MLTAVLELPVPEATDRFQILESGVRIARLGPGDEGWLIEFDQILRIAIADWLTRAHQAGTVEGVLADLRHALEQSTMAVWMVLFPDYRFLGFALGGLIHEFGASPRAFIQIAYLYPKRTPRSVLPALTQAILAWAASHGATTLGFQTRRDCPRAWRRVGATEAARVYTMPIAATEA